MGWCKYIPNFDILCQLFALIACIFLRDRPPSPPNYLSNKQTKTKNVRTCRARKKNCAQTWFFIDTFDKIQTGRCPWPFGTQLFPTKRRALTPGWWLPTRIFRVRALPPRRPTTVLNHTNTVARVFTVSTTCHRRVAHSGYAWTSRQTLSPNSSQSSSGFSDVGGDSGTLLGCLGTVAAGGA